MVYPKAIGSKNIKRTVFSEFRRGIIIVIHYWDVHHNSEVG